MNKFSQLATMAKDVLKRNLHPKDDVPVIPDRKLHDDRQVATPAVDVLESERELRIVADVPGAAPDSAAVSCDPHNVLVFHAAVLVEQSDPVWRGEFHPMDWRRSFQLPGPFDGCRAKATLRDGLLTISIPRRVEANARSIPVEIP